MHCLTQLNTILQVTGITSGRAAALVPAGIGLIGMIIGWIALRRSRIHAGKGRPGAVIAVCLGVTDLILSILHLIRSSDNNFGTGSGKLGAIVALVFAVIGIFLGGIAMSRSRASDTTGHK